MSVRWKNLSQGSPIGNTRLLCNGFFYVFVLSCVCYVFERVCLYVLCGHLLGKGWPLVSNCEFVTFPLVSWVRYGTWLFRFLIFAPLLTLPIDDKRWSRGTVFFFYPILTQIKDYFSSSSLDTVFFIFLKKSHTWFCIQICEYLSTRILAAARMSWVWVLVQ